MKRSASPGRADPLDVLQGTLELVALKAIAANGEMHGFSILGWIRGVTEQALVVEDGALYHALYRMERKGWLASGWRLSEKGRRAKYYRLTQDGEKALAREAQRWSRYVEAMARISHESAPL